MLINKQNFKTPMTEQNSEKRINNFFEVSLGYTAEEAVNEAKRCLNCKDKPCVSLCPVNVNIPYFIKKTVEGNFLEAYEIIKETSTLPAICGRVCPQEIQCESVCVRAKKGEAVAIGRLERFVSDYAINYNEKNNGKIECEAIHLKGQKVAVVGGGPAGLTCAGDLGKLGYEVTVFEALHKMGGVLSYGIPEFRLPKSLVKKEISFLNDLPIKMKPNRVIGKSRMVDELLEEGFDAIFIASGAGLPKFMNIPGENLCGVYSANEFLTRINLMKAFEPNETDTPVKTGKVTAVVGGGNVAMDAARCARRVGSEKVYVVYRRSEAEMPARLEEVHHAKEEGIDFLLLCNPTKINGDEKGNVKSITCIKMGLGEPDASGRRKSTVIKDSEFELDVDSVIIAIGNNPNPLIKKTTPDIKTHDWGGIIIDDQTGETSKKGVYAGGDTVTGAATVILAMGAGKKAATAIDNYLKSK